MSCAFSEVTNDLFQLLRRCPPNGPARPPPARWISVAIDRARILKAAGAALTLAPITITKFQREVETRRPHDYYSNGDYWWPDPAKTNGLPYLQRDGRTNPDNFISIAWRCASCAMRWRRWAAL